MPIDTSELPSPIREKIADLTKDIEFSAIKDKGSNGYVLVGFHKMIGRDVVVKFYFWGDGAHAEPALLAGLECDYVLKIYHAESINRDDAFFITPFCPKGDLDDVLERRKFGPIECADIALQLAAGASFLHGHGYLHRDLKPSNIFALSEERFVIGDFGSVVAQNEQGFAQTLTRHSLLYRPPEEITERRAYKQSDLYQLGIVLYQLLGGQLSYQEIDWLSERELGVYRKLPETDRQRFATDVIEQRIVRGRVLNYLTLPPWVPQKLASVIRKCCAVDLTRRFATAADMSAKLNNIRGHLSDWRIDEHPVLHRPKKQFRIVQNGTHYRIEKRAGTQWRTERRHSPATLEEAVATAEEL